MPLPFKIRITISSLPENDNHQSGQLVLINKIKISEYIEEIIEKEYYVYHPNGQIRQVTRHTKNMVLNGESKVFYESGQLRAIQNFKDGENHGVFIEYFEDGSISQCSNFKLGKQNGQEIKIDENGSLLQNCYHENGVMKWSIVSPKEYLNFFEIEFFLFC